MKFDPLIRHLGGLEETLKNFNPLIRHLDGLEEFIDELRTYYPPFGRG